MSEVLEAALTGPSALTKDPWGLGLEHWEEVQEGEGISRGIMRVHLGSQTDGDSF